MVTEVRPKIIFDWAGIPHRRVEFFVSGKFEDRANIRLLQQKLRDMGYEIVEDWTNHEYTDKGYPVEYAEADILGVKKCDVYVGRFIADYNYKGAFVEMGAAIALNKDVCVIGHAADSCIFVYHPRVKRFESEEEFLKYYE